MKTIQGIFSQLDARWGPIPLGTGGGHTLASAGCLVSAAAGMLADVFGFGTDPGRLNRWLCRNGGFASGNLFVFDALRQFELVGVVVDCMDVPAPMDQVAEVLALNGGVLALVDFYPGGAIQQHWVRIVQMSADDCVIHDPWLPRGVGTYSLMARYGHWSWSGPARAIFRLALYQHAEDVAVAFAASALPVSEAVQEGVCVRLGR